MMGYWEPHSSSVDFCESNYLHSPLLVEPHNVWSSLLGITSFGLLGIWQLPSGSAWTSARIAFGIFVLTGIGSAALHGTLHWFFQSSDELPMIYSVLCHLYMIAEVDAPSLDKPKYPWLAPAMCLIALVNTAIYFYFQNLYWVFLIIFITSDAAMILLCVRLTFFSPERSKGSKQVFTTGVISYLLVGAPVWAVDMLMCDAVVIEMADKFVWGITPHVVWHFAAGFGAYAATVFLVLCRCDSQKIPYSLTFVGNILPIFEIKAKPV